MSSPQQLNKDEQKLYDNINPPKDNSILHNKYNLKKLKHSNNMFFNDGKSFPHNLSNKKNLKVLNFVIKKSAN
jgi:hypothetical protein